MWMKNELNPYKPCNNPLSPLFTYLLSPPDPTSSPNIDNSSFEYFLALVHLVCSPPPNLPWKSQQKTTKARFKVGSFNRRPSWRSSLGFRVFHVSGGRGACQHLCHFEAEALIICKGLKLTHAQLGMGYRQL